MVDHPSLEKPKRPVNIQEIQGQVTMLRGMLEQAQQVNKKITEQFDGLDAIALIDNIQQALTAFISVYGEKIDVISKMLTSTSEAELKFLDKANKAIDALL